MIEIIVPGAIFLGFLIVVILDKGHVEFLRMKEYREDLIEYGLHRLFDVAQEKLTKKEEEKE